VRSTAIVPEAAPDWTRVLMVSNGAAQMYAHTPATAPATMFLTTSPPGSRSTRAAGEAAAVPTKALRGRVVAQRARGARLRAERRCCRTSGPARPYALSGSSSSRRHAAAAVLMVICHVRLKLFAVSGGVRVVCAEHGGR